MTRHSCVFPCSHSTPDSAIGPPLPTLASTRAQLDHPNQFKMQHLQELKTHTDAFSSQAASSLSIVDVLLSPQQQRKTTSQLAMVRLLQDNEPAAHVSFKSSTNSRNHCLLLFIILRCIPISSFIFFSHCCILTFWTKVRVESDLF